MLPPAAAAIAPDAVLLRELLAVSLTGVIFYTPVYDPDGSGEIVDFTFEYLNPAAQRMMSMPEVPSVTHNQQWPHSIAHGTFQFHVEAFVTGEPREYNINYQADGYDNYYRLAARRAGSGLLVSFTDTADQPRSPVEVALREAQAAEKTARAEVEAQRQLFYNVLMQLPAHVALHAGPDQVFTFVNPYYQSIANGRHLVGQPIRTVWPELTSHGILDILDRVYQTGETFTANEMPVQVDFSRTGQLEQVYYNFFFLALRDAQEQITGVLNFSYDVTDLVRARQQVEQLNQELEARVQERTQEVVAVLQRQTEAQALLYQVFEETPAAICIQRGPEHRYEYANAAYRNFFPGRTLLGRPVAEVLPETVETSVVDLLDRVYQTGETYHGVELPLLMARPEGPPELMYFTFSYQAFRENGKIVGISTFAYNVAEQVLARQARETERQRLLSLFREVPAGICILAGPDLVYEFVNPRYQDFLPGRDLQSRPIFEALPELVGTPVEEILRQVYATGQTRVENSLHIPVARPYDGVLEDRYFTFVYQGRRDEHDQVIGILAFVFEVTEHVQARQAAEASTQQAQALAQELATTNEQPVRTNVDLDNFIYTASHDLKAPISNIEGLLYLLQAELPAAVAEAEGPTLSRMLDSVERFKRTINHLTDVSKLQKGHAPISNAVDLLAVIEDVRQDLAPQLQESGAKLVLDVADLPLIHFPEKNLRSVVYNLLSNALKYRSPSRTLYIDVRAHLRNEHAVLEVHDNGLGIAPAHLPRLFAMFQRFHDHVEGSGIGLYMVKRMIENAGGRIEVHSQLGAGTTFFVYLPQAPAVSSSRIP